MNEQEQIAFNALKDIVKAVTEDYWVDYEMDDVCFFCGAMYDDYENGLSGHATHCIVPRAKELVSHIENNGG